MKIKKKIKKVNKITNIKKIRIIDNIRFWINLLTSVLFIYLAYDLNRPISMGIGWLLLIGWMLGAYERRLLMKRRKWRRKRRYLRRIERDKERKDLLKLKKQYIKDSIENEIQDLNKNKRKPR